MNSRLSKIGITAVGACLGGATFWAYRHDWNLPFFAYRAEGGDDSEYQIKNERRNSLARTEHLRQLMNNTWYDVLIIGGGATGTGCALDATTRGLKTALVECNDFASGTSSRSTKLIHGGVRYLQSAIMKLDRVQYDMVKEALEERGYFLKNAPHIARPLPIMIPIYSWWKLPYYWIGIKCYDLLAGKQNIKSSYYISKKQALELFPILKQERLCGALVYYDGQHDDARMCLTIALTAANKGATICNYVQVMKLLNRKDSEGNTVICGARVRDQLTGKEFDIKAKCVINATGPFTDTIRKMDDPQVEKICAPSSGVHIILPGCFCPENMGLLDPATSDGRVIFFLPWQGYALAGTTDVPCEVTASPQPTEEEIAFILNEVRNYFDKDVEVKRSNILSAWSGIRPLVSDPNKPNTKSLARNHIIHISPTKLITIAGGKWTTYRSMAEHTVDAAVKACGLRLENCKSVTRTLKLDGAEDWSPSFYVHLMQRFALDCEVAKHLAQTYGSRAVCVAKLASPTEEHWPAAGSRLHADFPYIDAEVRHAVRHEFACSAVDMIARRFRVAFLNVAATEIMLPHIVDIMAEELQWSANEKQRQLEMAVNFLDTEMNSSIRPDTKLTTTIHLSHDELQTFMKLFKLADREKKGHLSIETIQGALRRYADADLNLEELQDALNKINIYPDSLVDLTVYLQLIAAIKTNDINKFARMSKVAQDLEAQQAKNFENLHKTITIERACGGL